jgi:sugar lactone lactonase YvrE
MTRLKQTRNSAVVIVLLLCATTGLTCLGFAQTVKTVAGGFVGDGGPAKKAAFQEPYFIAQDKAGNLYVSDGAACRVREIAPSGAISTFAGTGTCGYTGDGGPADAATFNLPTGLAFDKSGNLYIADGANNVVRKISTSGIVKTFAGTGQPGYSGDGGPAKKATFLQPYGLVFDAKGNLYITDIGNHVVRKIDTSGIITTYAGDGTYGYGGDGGPATQATLSYPRGMAVDSNRNLYIADTDNFRVRVVDAVTHNIDTFAGNGSPTFSGDGGPAKDAGIGRAARLTLHNGAIYLNGVRSRVRYVPISSGIINTYAGSSFGYDGDGHDLLSSMFAGPSPFFDSAGHFLVVDAFNARVRRLVNGVMKTIAGGFLGDNKKGTSASLEYPDNIAFDSAGNLYIAEPNGNRVRKVDGAGVITTFAGNGISGNGGDGGTATAANLYYPQGLAVDSVRNLYIADAFNGEIRKVDAATGTINTFAADPNFSDLTSLAMDASNNLYSADDGACVVRKITPLGVISIVAGVEFSCGYNGDNIPATSALLNGPFGLAVDANGNLYLGDYNNNRVRKVTAAGIIKTIAGDGNCGFSGDGGPATAAEVCSPYGVAVNSAGSVFLADLGNLRFRKISNGKINTIAGSGNFGYNGDGLPALDTNWDDAIAVAVNSHNIVYLVDDLQTRVRRLH